MKKITTVLFLGLLYAVLIINYATAQGEKDFSLATTKIPSATFSADENYSINNTNDRTDKSAIKKLKADLKAEKINQRVNTYINNNFKNASELRWNNEENLISAVFKTDANTARVVYDKKGGWLYTIITFEEEKIPGDIRQLVEKKYRGFTILGVQQLSQGEVTLYKVFLEDSKTFRQILVCNDEITVYDEFTKAN